MTNQEMRDYFPMLGYHIGGSLSFFRRYKRILIKNLAYLLERRFNWKDEAKRKIRRIEEGESRFSFEEFQHICIILGCSTEKIIEMAIFLKSSPDETHKRIVHGLSRIARRNDEV